MAEGDELLARGKSPRRAWPWLAALLSLAAWLPSALGAGFSFDDREAVEHNPVVLGTVPWQEAFRRDYWEHRGAAGHYRPLATLTLRLDRALWGAEEAGFHLTNVLLHALVVLVAGFLLRRLWAHDRTPWLGLALFAAHPALADSVAWISGRSSMLAALFGLWAAWTLARPRSQGSSAPAGLALDFGACLLGTAASMLGKEDGVLWALVLPCIAFQRARAAGPRVLRAAMVGTLGAGCGLALALFLRALALGSPWIQAPHAPLEGVPWTGRLLVAGRGLLEAARILVVPLGHAPNVSGDPAFGPAALQSNPWPGVLGLSLFAAAGAAALWALWRARSASAVSLALALAAWTPFLQWVPSGEVFAPRFLYLPLLLSVPFAGAALAGVLGLFRADPGAPDRPRRPLARLSASLMVLGLCAGCWWRARVYASRASYRLAVLAERPLDVPSWNDLGLAYEEQGRADEALAAWRRASALDPRYSRAWSNLGRVALAAGRLEEALELLTRAVKEGPRNPVAHVNLGSARLAAGDALGAAECYRRALELAPGLEAARQGLALATQGPTR
ncbi:MAG: tetratricopeptide repeat protein [Planctomycetes bacterium]|nr:tetratricopeptide repeat protein [Planctomycetota bacterium]